MSESADPAHEELMETIARQALQVTRLERENARLHTKLELLRKTMAAHTRSDVPTSVAAQIKHAQDDPRAPDSSGTSHEVDRLARKYAELQAKFAWLESQHEKCRPKIEDALRKYREGKATCRAWRDYLEKDGKYSKELRAQGAIATAATPDEDGHVTQVPAKDLQKAIQSTKPTEGLVSPVPSIHSTMAPTAFTNGQPGPPQSPIRSFMHSISSNHTTVAEPTPEPEPQPQPEPDDGDYPVVVSARSLKRRARAAASPEPASQRVKEEPIELSSDDYIDTQQQSTDDEEYDLDGFPLNTPARNREQKNLNQRSRRASCEPAQSVPTLTTGVSLRYEGNAEALPTSLISMASGQHDKPHQGPVPPITEALVRARKTEGGASANVLQPLSVNVATPRRKPEQLQNSKSMTGRNKQKDILGMHVPKDRDSKGYPVRQGTPQIHANHQMLLPVSNNDHRLDDMLNKSIHERTPTLTRKALRSVAIARNNRLSPHLPTPVFELKRASPDECKSQAECSDFPRPCESPPPIHPDEEPLRSRDPKTLRIEDFRVNPNYLGTDFSFADTLRGRDARRNLQVCTRADCCGGALEKAVAFGGPAVSGKTDSEALEAYLGRDWGAHIGAYGANKHKAIVMQAHVHVFANKHGKHKHAFARRSTPPGFWDTDFPTTQEAAQHRKKAAEMQQEDVMERWREALQKRGRWKFRDE